MSKKPKGRPKDHTQTATRPPWGHPPQPPTPPPDPPKESAWDMHVRSIPPYMD